MFTFIALLQGYWIKLENTLSVVWSAVAQQCYVTLAVDGSVCRYRGFELLLFFWWMWLSMPLEEVPVNLFVTKFIWHTSCFCWKPSLTQCLCPAGRCWWKDGLYVDFSAVWRMYVFIFLLPYFLGSLLQLVGLTQLFKFGVHNSSDYDRHSQHVLHLYLLSLLFKTHTHSWSLWMTAFLLSVINSHTERNKMEKYVCVFFSKTLPPAFKWRTKPVHYCWS